MRRTVLLVVALLTLATLACSSSKGSASSSSTAAASTAPSTSSSPAPLRVLVSNDDGVGAPGIDALVQALAAEPAVDVTVVAPSQNQSGSGGKTTPGPLTASPATTASGHAATAVDGFPADAVLYGLDHVMTSKPDLVVSGINAGQNTGPLVDISGTVGAARAAAQRGIPALAVSAQLGNPIDFAAAVTAVRQWLHDHRPSLRTVVVDNLNTPTCTAGHVRGVAETTVETTATTDAALAPSDCTSTAPPPAGDVDALHVGFATLSHLTPSS